MTRRRYAEVTRHHLLRCLQGCIGREQGKPCAAFALALNVPERTIRGLVTELRNEGIAVCGRPETGYFLAQTPAELEETCKFLRSRAMKSLVLEAKLRGIPLADLVGQLRLPT